MITDDKPAPVHCGVLVTTCGLNADYERFAGTWDIAEVTCKVCVEREERRRAARRARRQEPDDLTLAAINHSLKVMAEHGGGTPDHVEEGAMDPVKPAHPAPWRWDASPGSIVATTALLDAAGDPVLKAFANPLVPLLAFVRVAPSARAVIESAGEMEALLRHVASEVLPMEYGRPDGKPGGIAEAAQEIVDRIDATKGG